MLTQSNVFFNTILLILILYTKFNLVYQSKRNTNKPLSPKKGLQKLFLLLMENMQFWYVNTSPGDGSGLCSKGARVPQATNFCLWATR